MLALACAGLGGLIGAPDLMDALQRDEEGIKLAEADAALAKEEVDRGFPTILGQAVVGLWGALEVAVRDFLALWIERFPRAKEGSKTRHDQGPTG